MSADNLYRTFPSKEATVEGLCPRDQQERIASFVHLADSDSVFVAIAAGLRAHIENGRRTLDHRLLSSCVSIPMHP